MKTGARLGVTQSGNSFNHWVNANPHLLAPPSPLIQSATLSQQSQQQQPPLPNPTAIVWGTRNGTKAIDIRNALCELTQVCPENVTVHRSVRPYGSKSLWWFTIISDEKTILLIEESWESICPSHEWVLIKTLKDRPRRPLSNKQSQANQGMGNILHAPRTSDETTPRTNTSACWGQSTDYHQFQFQHGTPLQ